MNDLINQNIEHLYNSDDNNIVDEFYCKCLLCSKLYKRAVPYFSSKILIVLDKGLKKFIENGGKIKLLVSSNLLSMDIDAINKGYRNRRKIEYSREIINFDIYNRHKNEQDYLSWLVYKGIIDIKIISNRYNKNLGIYHGKIGIFEDFYNNKVAFNGSMNETLHALKFNYEYINIYHSWTSKTQVECMNETFDNLWNDKSKSWKVDNFEDVFKENESSIDEGVLGMQLNESGLDYNNEKMPEIPSYIKLRKYQNDAIQSWFDNKFKGILEMATGTGKTITAICAIVKVLKLCKVKGLSCGLVIVVPYKSLLEQWVENLKEFNIDPIMCYENKELWYSKLNNKINLFNSNINKNLFIITTNSTFNGNDFQNLLCKIDKDYILCIDEMHHVATKKYISNLPNNCNLRLGLSATLQSEYNKENMDKAKFYFGDVIYNFSMERAIEEGFLTPYYYYPIFVELTDEEKYEYFKLTNKIGKIINISNEEDSCLTSLLMKRARIIGCAENKIKTLSMMKDRVNGTKFNIFYCGDEIENDDKYIYKVNRVVANNLGLKTHTFTSEENKDDRTNILEKFTDGRLDAISAIRCLDEGIDIPQLRRAFILSSSTNPKEFIQRRGRILRRCENKDFAEIYDFIVVPSLNKDYIDRLTDEEKIFESKILLREIKRFDEFAKLAINYIDAHRKLMSIWDMYDI